MLFLFLFWFATAFSSAYARLSEGAHHIFHPPRDPPLDIQIEDQFHLEIETPDLKDLKTGKLILGNGLKVFLVSDPGIVKAGAALSVETGNWRDPDGVHGLAHFTEHMLFMGSQEFPAEGEYDRYITANAGMNNAWTSGDHTLYYFNILPQGLLGALDRLSQFFIAPLFDPSALARERQAVNSEYNMAALRDPYRMWYVEQDIMRKSDHPFSNFGCGNITTLESLDQNSIRNWFTQEYDPRGMHLVVEGREPLDILAQKVKERFGKIPYSQKWKGPVRAEPEGNIIPRHVLQSWVYVEPIKDFRNLRMMWEIPFRFANWGNRAAVVAAAVLSEEGEGSVFAKLKEHEYATSFSAEAENEASDAAFFYVNAELTEHGVKQVKKVVEIIFQAISMLGRLDLPVYTVEQHNVLSELNFKWQSRQTEYRLFADTVYSMRQEDFLDYPHKNLFWEYNPYDVSDLFRNCLVPSKSIVFVQAKASPGHLVIFDRTDPIVGVKYSLVPFSKGEKSDFDDARRTSVTDIRYPKPSTFIPDKDVKVIHPQDPENVDRPRWQPAPIHLDPCDNPTKRSVESGVMDLYMSPDVEFGIPKIDLKVSLFSPKLNISGDPHMEVIGELWIKAVMRRLQILKAESEAAGYSFAISIDWDPSPRLALSLQGFSSRQAVGQLMSGIFEALLQPKFKKSFIRSDLEEITLVYKNQVLDELYKQTAYVFKNWAFDPAYYSTGVDILRAIEELKRDNNWQVKAEDEIKALIQQVFSETGFHEFLLFAGNVEEDDLREIEQIQSKIPLTPKLPYIPPLLDVFRKSFIEETANPVFFYRSLANIPTGRSAVRLNVPTGVFLDPDAVAFTEIMTAMCAGQFFAALRTREQLGYAVGSAKSVLRTRMYMSFVVQTEKLNGTDTLGRIQNWVNTWIVEGLGENDQYIEIDGDKDTVTPFDQHFEQVKDGVVKAWESKHPSLEAKTDEQEFLLLWSRDNPELRDQILEKLRTMTRDQFRDGIKQYFGATKDWRAVVLDGVAGSEQRVAASRDGWSVVTDTRIDIPGPSSSD